MNYPVKYHAMHHLQGDQIGGISSFGRHFMGVGRIFFEQSPIDLGEFLSKKKSPKIHLNKAKILAQSVFFTYFFKQ
jgi:hypothetical protein